MSVIHQLFEQQAAVFKAMSICALLVFVAAVFPCVAQADLYRCQTIDGTVLFSDNPINFPAGCDAEEVKDVPRLESGPSIPSRTVKQGPRSQASTGAAKQNKVEAFDDNYESLKGKTDDLVENYLATSKRANRSNYSMHKVKARQELREMRMQKADLLEAIDRSALKSSQKNELHQILSEIPDE